MGIIGKSLNYMPWQDKPKGYEGVIWRYDKTPLLSGTLLNIVRIFNSAVISYKGEFVGIFRADHNDGKAMLHFGRSRMQLTGTSMEG